MSNLLVSQQMRDFMARNGDYPVDHSELVMEHNADPNDLPVSERTKGTKATYLKERAGADGQWKEHIYPFA